jgi:hypothetical protein
MTRFLILLLVWACAGERPPRPAVDTTENVLDSLTLNESPPQLAMARVAPPSIARWADTTRRGDTVLYSWGRTVTKVETDSTRSVLYGLLFGFWHPPTFAKYTGGYIGFNTILIRDTTQFIAKIRAAKAANRHLLVNPVVRLTCPDTTLWISKLAVHRSSIPLLTSYADSGTIAGLMLVDEPYNPDTWICGSAKVKTPWSNGQLVSIAGASRRMLPTVPRGLREDPVTTSHRTDPLDFQKKPRSAAEIAAGRLLRAPLLSFALFQYEGPLHLPCAKSIGICLAEQTTAAKAMGLSLVVSLNWPDGGDGTSRITNPTWHSDPDVSDAPSWKYRYQMTPAELLKYGSAALKNPDVCALILWKYDAGFEQKAQRELDSLTVLARNRPFTRCQR